MRFAWKVAIASWMLAASSYGAEDFDGIPCTTSADCGTLKCIDARCQAPVSHSAVASASVGQSFMFGDGEGYGMTIAAVDVAAVVTEPLLMLGATSSQGSSSTLLGIGCFVPVGLAGPIVHATHGRWGPAIISLFAWTSLAATTFAVGGLFGLRQDARFDPGAAWAGGLAFGALGAAALTWLDVKMARGVVGVTPSRGGALATLGATW